MSSGQSDRRTSVLTDTDLDRMAERFMSALGDLIGEDLGTVDGRTRVRTYFSWLRLASQGSQTGKALRVAIIGGGGGALGLGLYKAIIFIMGAGFK